MTAMAIINRAIRTRITRTIRPPSRITTTMAATQTNTTVISKVVMDTMMNRKFVTKQQLETLKLTIELADTTMPMPTTHTSTTEDTTKEASTVVNTKMSTTTISTMTKEHLLLVSTMAKATPNKSVVAIRKRTPRLSAISP
jgi:hypothetical protein